MCRDLVTSDARLQERPAEEVTASNQEKPRTSERERGPDRWMDSGEQKQKQQQSFLLVYRRRRDTRERPYLLLVALACELPEFSSLATARSMDVIDLFESPKQTWNIVRRKKKRCSNKLEKIWERRQHLASKTRIVKKKKKKRAAQLEQQTEK